MFCFRKKGNSGKKVTFMAQGGHDSEQEEAKKVLEIGKQYDVNYMDVYGFHTEIHLFGFAKPFNSCLFEGVDLTKENTIDD